jgi:4'-phosphopantetheinyl transferase EntD
MSGEREFQPAFRGALPLGILSGIHLPPTPDPVPEEVMARLHPKERELAQTYSGFKQVQWVGGRLAARLAMEELGPAGDPVLVGERGEPLFPPGISASVSHKKDLAVALACRQINGTLGIDLETPGKARKGIANRVLTPVELAEVEALPESRQWLGVMLRFSLKEALYKALHPHLYRYVAFEEAEVFPLLDGTAEITLSLVDQGSFLIAARYHWIEGRLLSTVRVQPAPEDPAR